MKARTFCIDGTPTKTLFDPQGYTAEQLRDRHRAVVIGHGTETFYGCRRCQDRPLDERLFL